MTHVLDETKINKFFRFLHGVSERALKGSLDVEQFTAVSQVLLDKGARAKNLLDYVAKGCPKVDYTQPVSKAKARGQKPVTVRPGTDTSHLRFLGSTTIAPTQGGTILAQAKDVFTGYLDSDFNGWCTDIASVDTKETPVDIYEMKENGNYRTLFGSFGVDIRSLCLTQGQIKEFARTHRHLLRQDGYATFFLFAVNGEVFVADVCVDGGELGADVRRFSSDRVWDADGRHCVVVPQLAI